MRKTIDTWYASRRLPVPVGEAAAALDQMARRGAIGSIVSDTVLRAAVVPVGVCAPGAPLRRLDGELRPRGLGPPVPVELELLAWSSRESELGLRPRGRRLPFGRAGRYFDAVHVVLEDLVDRLLLVAARENADPRRDAAADASAPAPRALSTQSR